MRNLRDISLKGKGTTCQLPFFNNSGHSKVKNVKRLSYNYV